MKLEMPQKLVAMIVPTRHQGGQNLIFKDFSDNQSNTAKLFFTSFKFLLFRFHLCCQTSYNGLVQLCRYTNRLDSGTIRKYYKMKIPARATGHNKNNHKER